jgi:hypothetical protein
LSNGETHADKALLKTHAEGVILAFAEGKHEIRWVITELANDLQRGLPKHTLATLLREMTYGRKYMQWRQQSNITVSRLKQLEKSLNLS